MIKKILKLFFPLPDVEKEYEEICKANEDLAEYGGKMVVTERGGFKRVFDTEENEARYYNDMMKEHHEKASELFELMEKIEKE